MDLFRTTFSISPSEKKITYHSLVMFMGSCFSEYMGNRCSDFKFNTDNNPFGIVYNPLSVKAGLLRLIENKPYTASDLFQHNDVWGSFDHHSRFSDVDREVALDNINLRIAKSADILRKTDILFLTFGTSYVYNLKSNGKLVSNCHKFPASYFNKERISVDQIIAEYNQLLPLLYQINPSLLVVFTVSPIRHWKDGAHDNQLSKAILLLAIENLCNTHNQTFYFPSYELVMDDLRDYRFYEDDMLHPNKTAINYIWDRFFHCFIDTEMISVMKEVEKVKLAFSHRPFNPESESHQNFIRQTLAKTKFLKDQYGIDFTSEEKSISENFKLG